MDTYSKFAPTQFDCRGLGMPDRQNWLVAPVSVTRDSGPLEESNFQCLLKECGGESDTLEVHRFGHWGPGWFEIILVAPDSEAARIAEECESALSDYPILDDSDYSEREWNRAADCWACMSVRDRVAELQRDHGCIFEARRDTLPHSGRGELISRLVE